MAEPRWDRDLAYGQQGELYWDDIFAWFARGNGRREDKRKRRLDLYFYVETECDKGRTGRYEPSGISVSEADIWTYLIGETGLGVVIPTRLLKEAVRHPTARRVEERDGSCPTRGLLVHLAAMLDIAKGMKGSVGLEVEASDGQEAAGDDGSGAASDGKLVLDRQSAGLAAGSLRDDGPRTLGSRAGTAARQPDRGRGE